MTVNAPSAKRSIHRRLIVVSLVLALTALCLSVALWAELAPHYLPLEKVNLVEASAWSPNAVTLLTRNDNRFSIWSGKTKLCPSQPTLCEEYDQAEITQQLTDWFIQHDWKVVQRDATTGWNVCDNMGIVQERSDLVFEQQSGGYYKPSACVVIEADAAESGFTIYATTINPSLLTLWSD